jgi:hypothetical protein
MDLIALGYYAAVCGVLGVASPWLGSFFMRFIIGGIVGVGAAALLPQVHAALAY